MKARTSRTLFLKFTRIFLPGVTARAVWFSLHPCCKRCGRKTIRRFPGQAFERGLIPHRQKLEFVV
jgi:hypothetical protein